MDHMNQQPADFPAALELLRLARAEIERLRQGWINADKIALEERKAAVRPEARQPIWRDAKDKPPHMPGEHHSEAVLILMKEHGYIDRDWGRIKIGHVSCGHWRPAGGNGNFDDDVEGWMPMPQEPQSTPQGD